MPLSPSWISPKEPGCWNPKKKSKAKGVTTQKANEAPKKNIKGEANKNGKKAPFSVL